jgi:hypothetical protein
MTTTIEASYTSRRQETLEFTTAMLSGSTSCKVAVTVMSKMEQCIMHAMANKHRPLSSRVHALGPGGLL